MTPSEVKNEILLHFIPQMCYNTKKDRTFLKWSHGPYSVEVHIPSAKIGKRTSLKCQIVSNYRKVQRKDIEGYVRTDEYSLETLKERLKELEYA